MPTRQTLIRLALLVVLCLVPVLPAAAEDAPSRQESPPRVSYLLNRHGLRMIVQRDTNNILLPVDENANGLDETGDAFGYALAAGDLNGSGLADVILGAPGEAVLDGPRAGAVFALGGSTAGPTLGKFRTMTQHNTPDPAPEAGDGFGQALTSGDFNGDGFVDAIIAAPGKRAATGARGGAFYLFAGNAVRLVRGQPYTQEQAGQTSRAGDHFGATLAAGDFDGDGFDDLAVAATHRRVERALNAGSVTVFYGAPRFFGEGRSLSSQAPAIRNARFGAALAVADFNADGYDDLAAGAPGGPGGGMVEIFWGSAAGLTPGPLLDLSAAAAAQQPGARFGAALAAADFDGDGYADLAIGAPGQDAGTVFLFLGLPSNEVKGGPAFRFAGAITAQHSTAPMPYAGAGDGFGETLAAGDLNADGLADLAVGAPQTPDGATPGAGAVYVFPGARTGLGAGAVLQQRHWGVAADAQARFGHALALADTTIAGVADLIIGAPGAAGEVTAGSGAVYFAPGRPRLARLTHGGLVGAVTDTTAKIWARADQAAALQVKYKREDGTGWTVSPAVRLRAADDFSAVITLTGLTPKTRYNYLLLLNGAEQPHTQRGFYTFIPQDQAGRFRFAMSADIYYPYAPFVIFDRVAERQPDFMLLLGDQFYADGPDVIADTKAAYMRRHKENWGEPYFRAFTQKYPTFMIWDDHEILNDWDQGMTGRYGNARAAYDIYQHSHNPAARLPGELFYSFKVGDTEFYVLDTRSYRSDNGTPDGPAKTMLGAAQKADLKRWLQESDARFKFIVSSVPFHDFANTGSSLKGPDGWVNFSRERAELFATIRDLCIPGVVLLTGDQHWTGVFKLPFIAPYNLYEFMPTPLATATRGMTASTDPQILYKSDEHLVYGLFEVDTAVSPARIRYQALNEQNTILYEIEITAADILPPGACTP